MSQTQSKSRITRLIAIGRNALNKQNAPDKEVKRFTEIYTTVYRHARSKGQSHKAALTYCFNVYTMYAPKHLSKIVKEKQDAMLTIRSKTLREIIRHELVSMREGEVVNLNTYKRQTALDPVESDPAGSTPAVFDAFISEMHNQITIFVEESMDALSTEQRDFLDQILDGIEDRLGMEEEAGFDVSSYEDEEDV